MKHIITIFLIINLLLTSCAYQFYDYQLSKTDLTPKEQKFIDKFEKAVVKHDETAFFKYLDDEYKQEQYVEFYESKTQQFLNDFFCGDILNTQKFTCVDFKDINKISLYETGVTDYGERYLKFKVSTAETTIIVYLVLNTEKIGIIGARG